MIQKPSNDLTQRHMVHCCDFCLAGACCWNGLMSCW